jgi:hypothetical protein
MTEKAGQALKRADNAAERRFTNARAHQLAQAARETEEAARDRDLQRRLKDDVRERHPEWFA